MSRLSHICIPAFVLALCACGSGGGTSPSSNNVSSQVSSVASSSSVSSVTEPGSESSSSQSSVASSEPSNFDLSSVALSQKLGVGWNLGNTLEAVGGETAWGNPKATPELMQAVKAAGFDSIRIPVAWSQFSDAANFVIATEWMDRVEEVVNDALDAELYVMMNMHWDGGWMQPTYAEQDYVLQRMDTMWRQIAERFANYDEHLIFACTNEVMVEGDYGTPSEEYYTVQNGYNQQCVDTVRATGGNNPQRFLAVQGFNTNIDHTLSFFALPEDPADDKLLVEVHYYDPFNFTLNAESQITQWGDEAEDPSKTESWANEGHVDRQFGRMKARFVDQGIGVILGEYGAMHRPNIDHHQQYQVYWDEYITASALENGLVPVVWDNGVTGNNGLGLFNRSSAEQAFPVLIDAITGARHSANSFVR
ncbi:glycoside hydrolase family 5 protein [Gilvimarinus sp. DA14]|uniref:glycoside hydrolase family 5 protein n=1 Tax=Gilvimarinus sp. DA14 TaxID=2956798 RepID=UPI0020B8CD97|nr:glycoside hydrolase family 5 protein [Gilvimarinus sp. DA14]UTF60443.1 glycoside hydrolase family 5 protein [Gilvimarinus sp. DA14]